MLSIRGEGENVDPNKFHYLVCGCVEFDCGRTYGRTDGWTFLPGLLGHLGGDDLKIGNLSQTHDHIMQKNAIFTLTKYRHSKSVQLLKNHICTLNQRRMELNFASTPLIPLSFKNNANSQ